MENASAFDGCSKLTDVYYGGGYTYYKLRNLGKALGFNVSWFADKGIVFNSNEPYSDAN